MPANQLKSLLILRERMISEFPKAHPEEGFPGGQQTDDGRGMARFAAMLGDIGLPVDGIIAAFQALHSEYAWIGSSWRCDKGTENHFIEHGWERPDAHTHSSPFEIASRSGNWVLLDLESDEELLPAPAEELRLSGFKQVLTIPMRFSSKLDTAMAFVSKTQTGFGHRELAMFSVLIPTLSLMFEMLVNQFNSGHLLKTYVGSGPQQEILSGATRRGQVTRIRSAIMFCDMRDYTSRSSAMSPEKTVAFLNAYFDCIVPCIEDRDGEVLKYIGDGVLAIFRDNEQSSRTASVNAMEAAVACLEQIEKANNEGRFSIPIAAGIALHHGEAAFGNIGYGSRLDFTVVGSDVNITSRLANLNKELGKPLLASRAFADKVRHELVFVGAHAISGISEPLDVFSLS